MHLQTDKYDYDPALKKKKILLSYLRETMSEREREKTQVGARGGRGSSRLPAEQRGGSRALPTPNVGLEPWVLESPAEGRPLTS